MDKTFWEKMKIGFLTLSMVGLLAACGTMDSPETGGDEAPVEDPANDSELPPGGSEDGSEEMPPGGSEDGSEGEEAPGGGDDGSEGETTDN